jgi:hypothetical protein
LTPVSNHSTPPFNDNKLGDSNVEQLVLKKGNVVVIDHPMFDNQYLVAEIAEEPSKTFVQVRYMTPRPEGSTFNEEVKRRKREAVLGLVRPGADPSAIAKKLRATAALRLEAIKSADQQYMREVRRCTEAGE